MIHLRGRARSDRQGRIDQTRVATSRRRRGGNVGERLVTHAVMGKRRMKDPARRFLACALVFGLIAGVALSCADDGGATVEAWTDPSSGLTWQGGSGSGYVNWAGARAYCDDLEYAGRGDWRLPTISELRTLIRGCDGTMTGGACRVTDSCTELSCQDESCYPCDYGDGPNDGCYGLPELPGGCDYDWSSTRVSDSPDRAWAVGFTSGFVYKPRVYYAFHARCVR